MAKTILAAVPPMRDADARTGHLPALRIPLDPQSAKAG
jgi:hypothetical protein